MQLGTATLFGLGMCRTTGWAPAECQLSKSGAKTRNNFQTTLSRSLPEHSFLSPRCLMFDQAVIRQRVTAAGAWNVIKTGRVVNNKQKWPLLTAICIAWLQAGNISQMANCKFLYLTANNWGCSSRMLSAEIMSLWGSQESWASTTNMILWPKVLCAPCLRWQVAARLQEGCGSHPVPAACPGGAGESSGNAKGARKGCRGRGQDLRLPDLSRRMLEGKLIKGISVVTGKINWVIKSSWV